ncbi:MAG: sigma 54-interacting transcriptional regulator [Deltaproteobacteria bacterium]|nr:sigma 54-interacting transcriptional regulator [Deltaproteobacteria bacterium]
MGADFKVELIDSDGRVCGASALETDELLLGRDLLVQLGRESDPSVSRRHARLLRRGAALFVEDLGSRNGTLVNGVRAEGEVVVKAGDVIEVGRQRFRLRSAGATSVAFDSQPAPALFEGATLAATRSGAPERLRLIYDLTRLAGRALAPRDISARLVAVVERSVRPKGAAVYFAGSEAPIVGAADASPFSMELLSTRVIGEGHVLRMPGGAEPATALALPLAPESDSIGALVLSAIEERPFSDDDISFVVAAAALAGEALRRARLLRTMSLEATTEPADDEIVGRSSLLVKAKRTVDLIAPHDDLSVLLIGETGTGKELFARRVHRASGRSGPFVAVNVAALPADLLESELFGNTKGAFTGALTARTGYVEYAAGGTLFLDEIGEMPVALQAKLLRVLQEKKMNRVGDPRSIDVDVRIVAATNANISEKIAASQFREDLYFRLAGKEISIPPLRDREGDVLILVEALIRRNAGRTKPVVRAVSSVAMGHLSAYAWPGNVRELEGALRLAVIHAAADGQSTIGPEHLDPRILSGATGTAGRPLTLAEELEEAERRIVLKALRLSKGNKREAARQLGWSINTLRDRLERFSIGESDYG